jgi:hypothetical protein
VERRGAAGRPTSRPSRCRRSPSPPGTTPIHARRWTTTRG